MNKGIKELANNQLEYLGFEVTLPLENRAHTFLLPYLTVPLSSPKSLIPLVMRLFTHNFLQCHVRTCTKDNFPLQLQAEDADVQIKTAEFNADFLALQMCKIDYQALLDALNEVS